MTTPDITFIIPHKGREAMLIDTVKSIAAQQIASDQLEIIVVSQNQQASPSLYDAAGNIALSVIHNDEKNTISHSRNLGAKSAKGEFLAFLDADIQLSENWVDAMKTLLRENDFALVSAIQVDSHDAASLEKIRTVLSNAKTDCEVEFLPGRNLFLRKSTFEKVGGFPEHLITCEDYYFTQKVSAIGPLMYSSAATYVHLGEDKEFIPMFKKEIWRGQSNIASLKGRNIPFSELPSFFVPIAVVLCWLCAVVLLLAGLEFAALISFAVGWLPILVYSARAARLSRGKVPFRQFVLFYLLYFPARALGTVAGITKSVTTTYQ